MIISVSGEIQLAGCNLTFLDVYSNAVLLELFKNEFQVLKMRSSVQFCNHLHMCVRS